MEKLLLSMQFVTQWHNIQMLMSTFTVIYMQQQT